MKRVSVLWVVVLIVSKGYCLAPCDFSVWGTINGDIWNSYDWRYQCHGDADGLKNGLFRVSTIDASIVRNIFFSPYGWPAYYPVSMNYDPRADFDRNFIVNDLDTAILEQWLNKTSVPADCGKKIELKQTLPSVLYANVTYKIEWNWKIYTSYIPSPDAEDNPKTFSLYYSTDNGQNWIHIATVSYTTSYYWTVPNIEAASCQIRLIDESHPGLGDQMSVQTKNCLSQICGDMNKDCYVNLLDLEILGRNWLDTCSIENNSCENSDITSDEKVDFIDFSMFSEDWNKCSNAADSNCTH